MYKRNQMDLVTTTSTTFIDSVEREYKSTSVPGFFSRLSGYTASHNRFTSAVEFAKNRNNGPADDRANTLMIETSIFLGWCENAGANCGIGIPAKLRALVAGYQLSIKTQRENIIDYAQGKEDELAQLQSRFESKSVQYENERKLVSALTNQKSLAEADRDRLRANLTQAEAKTTRLETELGNKNTAVTRLEAEKKEQGREIARQQGEILRLQGDLSTAEEAKIRAENRNAQLHTLTTGTAYILTEGIQGLSGMINTLEQSHNSAETQAAVLRFGIFNVKRQLENALNTNTTFFNNHNQDDPMQGQGIYSVTRARGAHNDNHLEQQPGACLIS